MGNIIYDLQLSSDLNVMAPPALGAGVFGPAGIPPGMNVGGIYLIVNNISNGIAAAANPALVNRYVGISDDIAHRFSSRLPTVTEIGLDVNVLQHVGVCWGTVYVQDGPVLAALPLGVPLGVPVAAPLPHGTYSAHVDGVLYNMEKMLIRFILTGAGWGGTVSNNQHAGPASVITNTGMLAIRIFVRWGMLCSGAFPAGNAQADLPSGGNW